MSRQPSKFRSLSSLCLGQFTANNRLHRVGEWLVRGILCFAIATLTFAAPAMAEDYNQATLVGVDFSGKVLVDSTFTKANLRESNLSHADLRGVSLFGANLEGANLEGTDFQGATLDKVRFTHANLTNAILAGAYAFNAKFEGATIDGADFTDVDLRQDALNVLCPLAKGVNPVTHRATKDTLYCD
jgi:uncharacterized protein YjbI with pentapeptide repeats